MSTDTENPVQQVMTSQHISLKEPEPFNFSKAQEWTDWKERFERYRMATKLHKEAPEEQVNTLIYIMEP